eukprot:COSAG01_NODE_1490_length_10131_cov_15.364135_12_plen_80_part_01
MKRCGTVQPFDLILKQGCRLQIGENVTRTERHTPISFRSSAAAAAAPRRRPRLDPDGGAGPGAAGGPRADVGEVVLLLRP